jgi:hypothetical protein
MDSRIPGSTVTLRNIYKLNISTIHINVPEKKHAEIIFRVFDFSIRKNINRLQILRAGNVSGKNKSATNICM